MWFGLWTDTTKAATPGRGNRRAQVRNASADELEVLLCLQQLCLANGQVPQGRHHGCVRLLEHGAGFYGLALALVSNLTKTRSVALQVDLSFITPPPLPPAIFYL